MRVEPRSISAVASGESRNSQSRQRDKESNTLLLLSESALNLRGMLAPAPETDNQIF
jgi:hypothetical protein